MGYSSDISDEMFDRWQPGEEMTAIIILGFPGTGTQFYVKIQLLKRRTDRNKRC